jgi:uroporphyrinogen decarboxylase
MGMTSKERVRLALRREIPDRVPIHDAPWATTIERWHREGLPPHQDPMDYFGYEICGTRSDTSFQFESETVEETEEYALTRNGFGALVRNWKHATSTPEVVDVPCTDRRKWEELKPRMLAMNDERLALDRIRAAEREGVEKDRFFCFNAGLGFNHALKFVGMERLLIAMLDEPDWARDMFETSGESLIRVADALISRGVKFDGAFLYDDMGYRNGPLFSPKLYRELLFPTHARVFGFLHDCGLPVILHSCGCVKPLVGHLVEAGLDCLQPLEVKAGMDVVALKTEFGAKLAFMGGIDVRKMALDDPAPITDEVRVKFAAAMKGGGYLYHSDHSVPDDVSFANYVRVMELVKKFGKYS